MQLKEVTSPLLTQYGRMILKQREKTKTTSRPLYRNPNPNSISSRREKIEKILAIGNN